ncbi:unnamed protein product, partial [Aureobasidium vineae]
GVHGRLHYLGEKNTDTTSKRKLACKTPALSVLETIHDVRGLHDNFTLDLHGFRYVKAPTKFEGWASEQDIKRHLIPEIEDLLRHELEGCDEINVIDIKQQHHENRCNKLVCVDYTAPSVESLLHQMYEIKADYLLAGRVRLIKPIQCSVTRSPIAIADGSGVVAQRDISTTNTGSPRRYGIYRDGCYWYYMSEQAEEDVLLFKTYDSDQSVPATTYLRTTFDIPNTPTDTISKTIEIQALVFTHPVNKQVSNDGQLEEKDIQSLKRKISALSDEVSHNQALVRAGLDLRQWESSKTAERIHHLISDRDHSRAETLALSMQLNYLEDCVANFYMSWSSSCHQDALVGQMQHLICSTPRLRQSLGQDQQAHLSLVQSMNVYGPDAEMLLLRQRLQAQCAENERLKVQINTRVEDKMNEAFSSALQVAVKNERGQDNVVIEALRQEIYRLHLSLEAKTPESEDSTELTR